MYIILNRYDKLNKPEIKETIDDNNNTNNTINNDNSLATIKINYY